MHNALNMNKSDCNPLSFKDSDLKFYHEDDIPTDSKASLGECNWTRTQNHLVRKRTLTHPFSQTGQFG